MKLKYYLRGVGTGIIFATLVMAVSCLVHKYNLSDEFIIREARRLGMVKEDEIRKLIEEFETIKIKQEKVKEKEIFLKEIKRRLDEITI